MMRSIKKTKENKTKEKDPDSKNQPIVANLSKLICTTKGQSSTLNGKIHLLSLNVRNKLERA